MRRVLLATLFFVALVAIWHFLVQANIWSPVLLPSPKSVGEYLLGAARDGTLLQATIVTVRRLLVGYVIGIAIGLPLGLFTSAFKFMEDTVGVLALGLADACRASAGFRWPCFGSAKPKARCCSSSSWERSGRS